jgi:arylformamidase
MPTIDLEAEYNNRQRVPEHPQINARWSAASVAYRQTAKADLDQPYGPKERHRYDLFRAGDAKAPLAVYIHGGYWQRGDRKDYSFVAKELNAAGIDVALPSYSLCPAVSVMDIVAELRLCLAAIWQKTKKHSVVTGHSAGGHLTAAMVATDWSKVAGVPADLVRAGVAISGVFDVAPLIPTSINDLAHLDATSARAASPLLWPPPPKGRTLVAAVGGDESSEFLRQSRAIAQAWAQAGLKTECLIVPGTDHFTVVDELTKPNSALFNRVVTLARQASMG